MDVHLRKFTTIPICRKEISNNMVDPALDTDAGGKTGPYNLLVKTDRGHGHTVVVCSYVAEKVGVASQEILEHLRWVL